MQERSYQIIIKAIIYDRCMHLENNPKQICTLIGLKPSFCNSTETQD